MVSEKQRAFTRDWHAKNRAAHTDEWYETVGNAQVLKCCTCGKTGVASEHFYRQKIRKAGFAGLCKECQLSANRNNKFLRRYGMTIEQREEVLKNSGGKCAICLGDIKRFHVDHCHSTGKVRGVLCGNCNMALGLFRDSQESLSRAIDYLKNQGIA